MIYMASVEFMGTDDLLNKVLGTRIPLTKNPGFVKIQVYNFHSSISPRGNDFCTHRRRRNHPPLFLELSHSNVK